MKQTPKTTRGGIGCPGCGCTTNEVTRTTKRRGVIRRTRKCSCGTGFITLETVEHATSSATLATSALNLKKALTAFGSKLEDLPLPNGE